MRKRALVDVALQVFAKPYQTALCLLSLMRHCEPWIGTIFFIIESAKPKYDTVTVTALTDLVPKMRTVFMKNWLGVGSVDTARLREAAYRRSVRYQYAWEKASSDFLLVIHNDASFCGDVIAPMLENMGDHIALGELGQCWNCPAARPHIVEALGVNSGSPCRREQYTDFSLTFQDLDAMYRLSRTRGEHIRNFLKAPWADELRKHPWPLPECRVNEWCCMINMRLARGATMPLGMARPFGAYASLTDLGVSWFRDVHRQGFRARHFDISPYVRHSMGHIHLWSKDAYHAREESAAAALRAEFPEYAAELAARGLPV